MQWSRSNTTEVGDTQTIYDGLRKVYAVIIATNDGFIEAKTYTRKEYDRYYERIKQSRVKFGTSSSKMQNDNGGDGTYDVRLGDREGNVSNDGVHGEERISDRHESDKQGNRKTRPDGGVKKSSRRVSAEQDAQYLELAKDPVKNEVTLRNMVEQAAYDAGLRYIGLHGTDAFGFTEFKRSKSNSGAFFFTNKYDL